MDRTISYGILQYQKIKSAVDMDAALLRSRRKFLATICKKDLTDDKKRASRLDTVWEKIYLYIILIINIYIYKEIIL